MRSFILAALAALSLATPAAATADGPDAWRVVGVASNDVLNVRVGPGTEFFVIDALPFNARGVQVGTCTPTITQQQYFALSAQAQAALGNYSRWCVVFWNGAQRGWVNARFLGEDG